MRLHLASDHAGLETKSHLVETLRADGHEVVDHGPYRYDPEDDYPPFVLHAATAVAAEPDSLGIVLGGSGNGEQMAANKVRGVRAALAWNEETARLARQHNDATVLSIGARMHSAETVVELVGAFLSATFPGSDRHARRIQMISQYEQTGELPPRPAEPAR